MRPSTRPKIRGFRSVTPPILIRSNEEWKSSVTSAAQSNNYSICALAWLVVSRLMSIAATRVSA